MGAVRMYEEFIKHDKIRIRYAGNDEYEAVDPLGRQLMTNVDPVVIEAILHKLGITSGDISFDRYRNVFGVIPKDKVSKAV